MSQKSEDSGGDHFKFDTNYTQCSGCSNRKHKSLFDKGITCRSCRGLNSDGTEADKATKLSKDDENLVNS